MDIKGISIVSGTALLALTATASAGPMSVTSSQIMTPPTQIEQVYFTIGITIGTMAGTVATIGTTDGTAGTGPTMAMVIYGYGYPYNNGYGYGTGLAALATEPLMTGRSVAASGDYCATPAKTCLLYHSSWVGNGCSCKVYDGYARGTVRIRSSTANGAEAW